MKKVYQIPATTIILVQPTQLMAGSGETVNNVTTNNVNIPYQGGGTGEGMSRRGGGIWDDEE